MAIAELVMPKLGESIMEATILKWHKKVGDHVKLDETVLDIATDKVDSEVPSTVEGIITELLFNVNDVVPIGTVIAKIETIAVTPIPTPVVKPVPIVVPVAAPVQVSAPAPIAAPVHVAPVPVPVAAPVYEVPYTPSAPTIELMMKPAGNRFYSPLVLNIANSEGVGLSELERIPGTGGDGRVSKKDILQYVADKKAGRIPPLPVQQPIFAAQPIQAPVVAPITAPNPIAVETAPVIEPIIVSEPIVVPEPVVVLEPVAIVEPSVVKIEETVKPIERFAAPTPPTRIVEVEAPAPILSQNQPVIFPVQPEPIVQTNIQTPLPAPAPVYSAPPTAPVYSAPPPPIQQSIPQTNGKISEPASVVLSGITEIIEMDRMRKLIANHMVNSVQTSPHVTSFAEADVTNMVMWREKVKHEFEQREGTKLTFTPMFIECVVKAMKNYPLINCSLDGDKIIIKKDINIGMATALPSGNLIVPVIKGADQLNIVGLSKSVNGLADAARNGRLKPEDTSGGTFTLTNVGTFGSLMGTPIINQPQVAIMAVGAIKKRAVVIESASGDTIGIRHMMYLSLSYDHRIVDGSIGASFLTAVAKEFEKWDTNKQWFHYL